MHLERGVSLCTSDAPPIAAEDDDPDGGDKGHPCSNEAPATLQPISMESGSVCADFHPLDALTADEIRQAAAVCRAYAEQEGLEQLRFNVISLQASSTESTWIDLGGH